MTSAVPTTPMCLGIPQLLPESEKPDHGHPGQPSAHAEITCAHVRTLHPDSTKQLEPEVPVSSWHQQCPPPPPPHRQATEPLTALRPTHSSQTPLLETHWTRGCLACSPPPTQPGTLAGKASGARPWLSAFPQEVLPGAWGHGGPLPLTPTARLVVKFLRPLLWVCVPREAERPAGEAWGGAGAHTAQQAEVTVRPRQQWGREHDRDDGPRPCSGRGTGPAAASGEAAGQGVHAQVRGAQPCGS